LDGSCLDTLDELHGLLVDVVTALAQGIGGLDALRGGGPESDARAVFSWCAASDSRFGWTMRDCRRLEFWSMTTMPLSEVKARLSEVADQVDRTHDRVHITRNGREFVVLISVEDLESLEATIELLSDPAAMARIRDAEAAIARGETTSAEEMALVMEQRRARERAP
jgi:antitoxin YefM